MTAATVARMSAEQTRRQLAETRKACQETISRCENAEDTTKQTLAEIRSVLNRWDAAKAKFGRALDNAARRIASAMQEQAIAEPTGPPCGPTAHGFDAPQGLADPKKVVDCELVARPKMQTGIAAHEFRDTDEALHVKVKFLADMLMRAKHACVYTGAGISTAAGIADYASRAGARSSVLTKPEDSLDGNPFSAGSALHAAPTYTHKALTALHRRGMLEGGWVQQNHDALPQKAGFPQEAINEIHGAWMDPSNPVVPMDGSLRKDLVGKLDHTIKHADLVIAMGTSLSGVSADRVVSSIGKRREEQRSPKHLPGIVETDEGDQEEVKEEPTLLGAVIINVQQTRLDAVASLRIFAPVDEVMRMLASMLSVRVPSDVPTPKTPHEDAWTALPYTADGERDRGLKTTLRLHPGAKVKIVRGNAPMVPDGLKGTVCPKKTPQGHYNIYFEDGVFRALGVWMMHAAQEGKLEMLPIVNVTE